MDLSPALLSTVDPYVGLVLLLAGGAAWAYRPPSRTGLLLFLAAALWCAGSVLLVVPCDDAPERLTRRRQTKNALALPPPSPPRTAHHDATTTRAKRQRSPLPLPTRSGAPGSAHRHFRYRVVASREADGWMSV